MTNEELRRMRKSRELSQADLAAALGYSRKSVISWENSVHPIPEHVAAKVLVLCFDAGFVAAPKASAKLIRATLEAYRKMRAPPNDFSHDWIMDMWKEHGFTPALEARQRIAVEFPDILPTTNPER